MKKAQIKFGETIGILFIIYLVLVFGLMWYNDKNNQDLDEQYEQNAQDRALEKYYYIIYSDLLKTSQRGFERNYFDLISIKAFANYSKTPEGDDFLDRRLGEGVITLDLYNSSDVYEGNNEYREIVLYNNSPEFRENSELVRSQVFTSIIPIKDDTRDNESLMLGVLRIETPFYE